MNIPCVDNKCLKYPICKSRMTIRCDVIYGYVSHITSTFLTPHDHNKHINILLRHMPNLTFVETEIFIDQKETAALLVGYMSGGKNVK
jgi:hypothetical protein